METLGKAFGVLLYGAYFIGGPATFIYLTFFDDFNYTAWNWIIAIPANIILASIWPIYWTIIRWLSFWEVIGALVVLAILGMLISFFVGKFSKA